MADSAVEEECTALLTGAAFYKPGPRGFYGVNDSSERQRSGMVHEEVAAVDAMV